MKKLLLFLFLFAFTISRGQLIVDNTTQTPAQLVQNVLLGSGITVSNITFNGSAANANSIRDQVGYFTNGVSTNIGIDSGIILATGKAQLAIGPNNQGAATLSTSSPMGGDPDLGAIAAGSINTKAILEFDFVPVGQNLSFNFVFGSEEYLEYVGSSFNDVFGFFLSGPGIAGPYSGGAINIALVPSTTIPISINNVNSVSNSAYYVNNGTGATPLLNPTIQYDGFTTVIAALANVQCGQTYHIKLAISNVGDSVLDSAVFLQAQSFNTSPLNFPQDYLIANGFAPCPGGSIDINSGLGASVPHVWTLNGVVIPGATGPIITATEPGEYCATAYPYGPACPVSDCLIVEFQPPIPVNPPNDLTECENSTFDLTENTPIILGALDPSLYDVNYFNTQQDAEDFSNPIAFNLVTAYPGVEGEIIHVRVDDSSGANCYLTDSFVLHFVPCNATPQTPPDLVLCDDLSNDGFEIFDFTPQTPIALGANNPADYTITYYVSLADAITGSSPINPIDAYQNISNPQTIYVRMEENANPSTFGTTSFQLIVHQIPATPNPSDVTVCDSYTLPALPAGSSYHSATGGSAATTIAAGTNITTTQTIYVFAETGTVPNCTAEGDFVVTVNVSPATPNPSDVTVCDSYTLPALPAGSSYHSATGGSAATTIAAGTNITTTQTIYVFAETGTVPNCTAEGDFVVTVNATPATPNPSDVTVCDSYTLPVLPAGSSYHSATGGSAATTIAAGTNITTTQTIYVFAETGTVPNCTAEGDFVVTVNVSPATPNPSDVTVCDSYTLPALPSGSSYHSATGGSAATTIAAGTNITTTQTIYVFAQTGTVPNCTAEGDFVVTINATPATPNPSDVTVCDSYTLPVLPAGSSYHSATGGSAATTIAAGTNITTTQTIYVFAETGTIPNCTAEGDFVVTINATPATPNPSDVTVCDSYTLPALPAGSSYHSATGGSTATTIAAGTNITTTQTIYVFAETGTVPNCTAEGDFVVTINATPATPNPSDVTACDSYTLPALPAGSSYHSATGGSAATTIVAGTNITTTQTIYVFAETGTVPNCTAEGDFVVTINNTPVPDAPANVTSCMSYTLPALTVGNYFTGSNGTGTPLFANDVITTTQTLYVYAQTGTTPNCSAQNSFTVTIIFPPTIVTPTNYVVCDDSLNNDGFYCFNLHTKDVEITNNNASLTVSYYETATDAITGSNPLATPYCNISAGVQTIYVAVYNASAPLCRSYTNFNLVVNPIPIPKPVITDYELCDFVTPNDGFEIFDLHTKDNEIKNGLTGVTITYYDNLADATNQTGTPLPNLYQNAIINQQQIWFNISNNTTGCNTTGTLNLVVNPLPTVVAPAPMYMCSNGVVLQAPFDLSLNNGTISNNASGVTVSYYASLADALVPQNPLPIPYTTGPTQTVYVRVANDATGCFATTTLQLNVTQGPIAVTPSPLLYCDPNNDGFGEFNLTDAFLQASGGVLQPGVSITVHETITDAQTGATPLVSPYNNIDPWTQTVYINLHYNLTGCSNIVPLQLIVNPTPEAVTPSDYHVCDDNYDGLAYFNLTTMNSAILGSMSPSTHTVAYYTSLSDAQSGTGAITPATSYQNIIINSQPIWAVVTITATGCTDIVTFNIVVDPLPQATQPGYAPYSLCETPAYGIGHESFDLQSQIPGILLGQTGMSVTFYPSLTQAQNNTNPITTASYVNIPNYVQTLGIRITNTATGCYVISTMDIRVNPVPSPMVPTGPYAICDTDQNGFSTFDLCNYTNTVIDPGNLYLISYFETQQDALLNNTGNALPCSYQNINPFVQFIWLRAEDPITHCVTVRQIELNVNSSPIAPPITVAGLCDQDSNTQNGVTNYNLETQTPIILAAQSGPAANYQVTYYTTQAFAIAGVPNIAQTTIYPVSDNQVIWFRVKNILTGCYAVGSFQMSVSIPLIISTPSPYSLCDSDASPNNQHTAFDLASYNLGLPVGYTATYYPSYSAAVNNGTPIPQAQLSAYINGPNAVQTLGILITSPQGCKSYTTLDIRVLPIPTPKLDPPTLEKCDDIQPPVGTEMFDLTLNENYIRNNDPNVSFTYFATLADAQANTSPINPINYETGTGSVYIRVSNTNLSSTGYCYVIVEQPLIVNPLPTVSGVSYSLCEADTNEQETFNLSSQIAALLGANQLPSDYTVTFYNAAGVPISPTAYDNQTNPETITVQVENNTTHCSITVPALTLHVEARAQAFAPPLFESCDDYDNEHDSIYQLDLAQFETTILGAQSAAVFLITYHHTQADADAGINALTAAEVATYTTTSAASLLETVYVRVTNSNTVTPCYATTEIHIHIEPKPAPTITTVNDINTICVDYTTHEVLRPLTLGVSNPIPGTFNYQWYNTNDLTTVIGIGPTYEVTTAEASGASQNFTVVMTSTSPLGCSSSDSFEVIQSGPAQIVGATGYTVTNAFSQDQVITVSVVGYGTYQYSLDDGPRQDSPVFNNVSIGTHTITVWDSEGGVDYSCDALFISEIQTIDYPHYFTPNGDGIHDTWNIESLSGQTGVKIYIFDRFGKLIKQISPDGAGWDGTYNGQPLPSTDYWFTVDYMESIDKQFKAHFSLKR